MVPGDHDSADTAPFGVSHSLDRFWTRRVDHGDQTNEHKIIFILYGQIPHLGQFTVSKGQNAEPFLGQRAVGVDDLAALFIGHWQDTIGGVDPVGALKHDIERTLCQQGRYFFKLVKCTHELAVRVKRQLTQAGVLAAVGRLFNAKGVADLYQSHLGGVSNGCACVFIGGGVAGEQGDF